MTNFQIPINISNSEPYLSQINQNLNIMNQLNVLKMMSPPTPLNIQLNNNFVMNSTLTDPKNIQQQSKYILIFNFNIILYLKKDIEEKKMKIMEKNLDVIAANYL